VSSSSSASSSPGASSALSAPRPTSSFNSATPKLIGKSL
jgi:hypothetical protein